MNATQTLNRLQKAIDSIEEKNGYCLVASETEETPHVVSYNPETYYATHCTCKSTTGDCYHRVAVDRHFEDKHPNFYAKVRKLVTKPVATYRQNGTTYDVTKVGSKLVTTEQEQAVRRAAYLEMYDPCQVA